MYNMGSELCSFLRERCCLFCFVYDVLLYIVRNNAKKFTTVGLSFKDVILFSKILYMFDVVYVKSNSISCKFSGLKVVVTLEKAKGSV